MIRAPYRAHPARLTLGTYGYTVSAVAAQAGVTPSTVTRQIAGDYALSVAVRGALVALIGEDATADVIASIPVSTKQVA